MNRIAMVNEGDLAVVDMNVIRHEDARRGMGLGHWLKVVRDTVRMGDGKVRVERIRGVDADVVADGAGAIMGPVTVPLGALRKAALTAAESDVVFHASSRGGRWELVGYADGKYQDLKNGKPTGSGGAFSRMGLAHKLAAMVQDSKIMDGINYIIDIDRLGVKQLLSKIDPSKPAPAEFYRIGSNMNKVAVAKELVAIANEIIEATETRLSLGRKPSTDEWVVKVFVNGKYDEDKSYYTDDRQDAIDTMKQMKKEMGI